MTRLYRDTESGTIVLESELQAEFERLKFENPGEYDYTFKQYLNNCLSKNGFLEVLPG